MKKEQDDYYKILGLRSNCRHERIQEKYDELVAQYPQAVYPAEFEKIQRAYEVLNNPEERERYNFYRKHGKSAEKLLKKGFKCVERGEIEQAEELFRGALAIDLNSNVAHLALAQVHLMNDNMELFEAQMQTLHDVSTESDRPFAYVLKAKLLTESDYDEAAIRTLKEGMLKYPASHASFQPPLLDIYIKLQKVSEILTLIDRETAILQEYTLDHLNLYLIWTTTMVHYEKWELEKKIQKRFRKFLIAMSDRGVEVRQVIEAELIQEYVNYLDVGIVRAAVFILELLETFNPSYSTIDIDKKQLKEWDRLQREMMRMAKDDRTFPPLVMEAFKLFWQETGIGGTVIEYANHLIPMDLVRQLEELDFDYAASIKYMQKKYPVVYRQYKLRWDALFEEKTRGLSREERRSIF